jgi:predicted aspartyl protease
MTRGIRLVAAIACLFGLTICAQAQAPANSCSLAKVTQLPLGENRGWFTTTVRINDHPVVMVIDTGAAHTAVSPELVKQLHLPQDRHSKLIVHGVGGDRQAAYPVIAHAFRAGAGHLVDYEMLVANVVEPGAKLGPDVPQGLLGIDLLSDYELEFDFPNRTLTLYTPSNCSGNFVPWSGPFEAIQGKRQLDGILFVPVSLNKESINAVIDTGSSSSSIGADTAHALGVSDDALKRDRAIKAFGINGIAVRSYRHRFDSFTLGRTTFLEAPLFVQDDNYGVLQMLLGMDVLRRYKLWLSFKTEQAFLQVPPPAHQKTTPQ